MGKKVLFVRFSSIGDIILTTGVINLFHKQYPEYEIHFLTAKGFEDLIASRPEIKKILSIDRKSSLFEYLKFIQDNINDYDYIFDLHSNLRTFFLKIFSPSEISSYKKDSFKRRMFVKFRLFKNSLEKHVVEKYYDAVNKILPVEIDTIEDLRPTLKKISQKEDTIVIHPFASKKTKEWPHFDELAIKLADKGEKITIVGNGNFNIKHKNICDLTNKTTFTELITIIAKAKLLITTDSGPMHIGIGCNTATIAIFGSTTKELGFYPIFEHSHVIENNSLDCRPCHIHGLSKCPKKHFKCMMDINADEVYEKIKTFLRSI
ncbi:glycosyltransferase family 9 protein [Deferribacter autotrophicus]|uniref:Glycosyltransferase family 9 protein n=1 Tax=Deferribacter autotrophicus TaxID=500465 RepID=A0A5A8F136_9BACT|nr:glycosyltransferase family 9 protein [Deferribacter autotrophicus]KAA0257369.1 glycosyltransferase family 9 protein [Deferribacter autotrophicus]